jgi:hypothetical protein
VRDATSAAERPCIEGPRPGGAVPEASGEIAGGPNVLGCSLFGINASVVLHFDPEIALDALSSEDLAGADLLSQRRQV